MAPSRGKWHALCSILLLLWIAGASAARATAKRSYYAVLGVKPSANDDELKRAYRRLALKHHPDKHGHRDEAARRKAEEEFKNISEAYSTLSNRSERLKYDSRLREENRQRAFGRRSERRPGSTSQRSGSGAGGAAEPNFESTWDSFYGYDFGSSDGSGGGSGSGGSARDLDPQNPFGYPGKEKENAYTRWTNVDGEESAKDDPRPNPFTVRPDGIFVDFENFGKFVRWTPKYRKLRLGVECTLEELYCGATKKVQIKDGVVARYWQAIRTGIFEQVLLKTLFRVGVLLFALPFPVVAAVFAGFVHVSLPQLPERELTLKLEAGMRDGSTATIQEGDLEIEVKVKQQFHPIYRTIDDDLLLTYNMGDASAARGGNLAIRAPNGDLLKVYVGPDEVFDGYVKAVDGRGLPKADGGRGRLLIEFKVRPY